MPAVSPSGSRGGLIAAVVVFTIGFVAASIFAIYFGVALSKQESELDAAKAKTNQMYRDATGPEVVGLVNASKTDQNLKTERTAIAEAISQIQAASAMMVGPEGASTTRPMQAIDQARDALQRAADKIKTAAVPDDLVGAVNMLADLVVSESNQLAIAHQQQAQAAGSASDMLKQEQDLAAKADADRVAEAAKAAQAIAALQAASQDYITKLTAEQKSNDDDRSQFAQTLQEHEVREQNLQKDADETKKQLLSALARLDGHRPSVEDAMTAKPDGKITQVASDNVVYINLGNRDQVIPGMTFEVYSQWDGIPNLGDGMSTSDMPIGEGSIVVDRVDPLTSECRVTKIQPGQHLQKNDIIGNLVYDRNVKYKFFLAGKFDLNQTGTPNDADRDKLKAIIEQWGGTVVDKINMDTDFVVLGVEPTVRNYSADELEDAFIAAAKAKEDAEVKTYEDLITQAKDLHIPLMNQNRFLYFCGFYDSAKQ